MLPSKKFTAKASHPHGRATVSIHQPCPNGLDVQMTEQQARQLFTALMGSLDWLDRQRRKHPRRTPDIKRLIREVLEEEREQAAESETDGLKLTPGPIQYREPGDLIEDPDGNPLGMEPPLVWDLNVDDEGHISGWLP